MLYEGSVPGTGKTVLKVASKKGHLTYGGNPIIMTKDFSAETMEASKRYSIFQGLKEKNYQIRILYLTKYPSYTPMESSLFGLL